MSDADGGPQQDEFIGRLGHELRTPLNAILGFSTLLQRADNLTERQRQGLATIELSGQRLLGQIDRLLELVRTAPGSFQLEEARGVPAVPVQPAQPQERRAGHAAAHPGTVLVIDDTPANVQLLTELLQGQGLRVLAAHSGDAGIELAQRAQPDVILLDVQMPGLGGFETCGVLKSDPRTQAIPIIFMTVISDTAAKVAAFEAGAADYVTKPFHVDEALARVQTQLRLTQAHKLLERQNALLQQEVRVRQRAEEEVRRLNAGLEARVRERTAQLEAANHELQGFCHSMAHDLRGPLSAIDGFGCLLAELLQDAQDARTRHYLDRIRKGVKQMDALTEALLALVHLGLQELRADGVDLAELASAALQRQVAQHPQRPVEIQIDGPLPVRGDPAQLRLLMDHLLGNAWKFTGGTAAPRIAVGCVDRAAPEPVYYVRDNGAGFDMAYADKLFKPFQRLHGASEFPGLGVGLAVAQRVVARHGGRIRAEAAPGQGACFFFSLPGAQPTPSA